MTRKAFILIADDQIHISSLVATAIRAKGRRAEIADSVEKTWKYLEKHHPAAILLNSLSQGFDSFDLLNSIKEKMPNLPAVLYTVRGPEGVDGLKMTLDEVLEKK